MGLQHLDVVEVGLPVFDDAVLVAGEEPVVAMGVLADADCTVVGLEIRIWSIFNLACWIVK